MQRILIVEDDIIICGGVKIFLESKGYKADLHRQKEHWPVHTALLFLILTCQMAVGLIYAAGYTRNAMYL